jgi:hypothetical protein
MTHSTKSSLPPMARLYDEMRQKGRSLGRYRSNQNTPATRPTSPTQAVLSLVPSTSSIRTRSSHSSRRSNRSRGISKLASESPFIRPTRAVRLHLGDNEDSNAELSSLNPHSIPFPMSKTKSPCVDSSSACSTAPGEIEPII